MIDELGLVHRQRHAPRIGDAGQPMLVGTTSIEKSELISELLKQPGLRRHAMRPAGADLGKKFKHCHGKTM